MTDDRMFVRHAHADLDPLISTDLERELIARLERVLDTAEIHSELLAALDAEGITTAAQLRTALYAKE